MADVRLVATSKLRPMPGNPRVVYSTEFEQLKSSIVADPEMLLVRPILAMGDGTIYAGAQRFQACVSLFERGWVPPWSDRPGTVPAIVEDVSEAVAMARAVRDNLHAGQWQEIELAERLAEIAAESGVDVLPTLGFPDAELRNIMAAAGVLDPVDPFSGRTVGDPREPENSAQKPVEGSEGAGASEQPPLPFTIVLRYSVRAAWDDAHWQLERYTMRRMLSYDESEAFDDEGRSVGKHKHVE